MERNSYLDHITRILGKNFNLEENVNIIDRNVDLYGKWTMEFGRNFISKTMVIDKFECNEHCLVVNMNKLSEEKLKDFESFLKECTVKIVNPHREHKTTYITGIIVADEVDGGDIPKEVKKFKYTKNYMLSIRGWSIVRIVVVDLKEERIFSNKAAKELVGSLDFEKVS